MPKSAAQESLRCFLNVPFDPAYERQFLALIASLVCMGRIPHCVLEIPEEGDGRLKRIFDLLRTCPSSIHDLSRVGRPVRFNMPFELGLAVALARMEGAHKFAVLEEKRFRLQLTLSDLNGIDPGIHGGSVRGTISCVVSLLAGPTHNVSPASIQKVYRRLAILAAGLKREHSRSTIYSRAIFQTLIEAAIRLAKIEGLLTM